MVTITMLINETLLRSHPSRRKMRVYNQSEESFMGRTREVIRGVLPPAVNWHLWLYCNYACNFCFATYEDIPRADRLSKEDALKVPKMLAKEGAEKITFVGGEPTMCPYLTDLLEAAKKAGLVTCIVSNGWGLTPDFLNKNHHLIDWVGISIDSADNEIHAKMGRGLRKDIAAGKSNHLTLTEKVWKNCKELGIKMKLNTVVCKENLNEDMSGYVIKLRPERWKIFEVLPVKGQNDECIGDLLLEKGEFQTWVDRHAWVEREGIQFVPESNEMMRGSYAMLDALGRFYSNAKGGHEYGANSILEVGVKQAWESNVFSKEKFDERGGLYDYHEGGAALPVLENE